MNEKPATRGRLFAPASFLENSRVAEVLRAETVGGMLLMLGAVIALVWANSPWSSAYEDLSDFAVGPHVLHLHLSLEALGRRRTAGDLLLRGRAGAQARVRGR